MLCQVVEGCSANLELSCTAQVQKLEPSTGLGKVLAACVAGHVELTPSAFDIKKLQALYRRKKQLITRQDGVTPAGIMCADPVACLLFFFQCTCVAYMMSQVDDDFCNSFCFPYAGEVVGDYDNILAGYATSSMHDILLKGSSDVSSIDQIFQANDCSGASQNFAEAIQHVQCVLAHLRPPCTS